MLGIKVFERRLWNQQVNPAPKSPLCWAHAVKSQHSTALSAIRRVVLAIFRMVRPVQWILGKQKKHHSDSKGYIDFGISNKSGKEKLQWESGKKTVTSKWQGNLWQEFFCHILSLLPRHPKNGQKNLWSKKLVKTFGDETPPFVF